MCDDCFDEDGEVALVKGHTYPNVDALPIHWTDAPIWLFGLVSGVVGAVDASFRQAAGLFKLHANYLGERREVAREMSEDLERIVGGS